jgi:hypothetical protein
MRLLDSRVAIVLVPLSIVVLPHACASNNGEMSSPPPGSSHTPAPSPEPPPGTCDTHGKIPFTPELVTRFHLTPADIQQLQFYASRTFVLAREVTRQDHDISLHRLVSRNGVQYEEIEVPCLTPGRVVSFGSSGAARDDHLFVSFEQGTGGIDFFAYPTRNEGAFSIYPPAGSHYNIEFEHNAYSLRGDSTLLIDREELELRDGGHHTLTGYTFDGGR